MKSLDRWRSYFRSCSASSDIFEIIDHAIMVAASDCPKEFSLRRDRIAVMLFSCKMTRCTGCDKLELSVPVDAADGGGGDDNGAFKSDNGASKESKVNSSRDDIDDMDVNKVLSNYSFGEAEALTDEIEEQSQFFDEVLRIRGILHNHQEESDAVLFESLRRLQLMELTVDCLKATEIGKAVTPLRKHASKDIRQLARKLIDEWKGMVDEWVNATATIAIEGSEGTPDSVNPSVVDEEEGLPSPPLDDAAFLLSATGSIELSQFFDGMDDDGNPRQSGQFKNRENGRKPSMDNQNVEKRKSQASNETNNGVAKRTEPAVRPSRAATGDSGPGRPPKSSMQRKSNAEPKPKPEQKVNNGTVTRKPPVEQQDKSKCLDDSAKLEVAKRKLQERYQQAENAKRQRTIQVMELNDIPKQGVVHRNPLKSGNRGGRQWGHGRR